MPITCDFGGGLKYLYDVMSDSEEGITVLIAGGSCSGKSYLALKLSERLSIMKKAVSILPLDNFFRDIDDPGLPRDNAGRKLFDVFSSYREDLYQRLFFDLIRGKDIMIPDYSRETNKVISEEGISLRAELKIITEGLFTIHFLSRLLKDPVLGDEKKVFVYIDIPEEICLERRIKRDMERYGITEEQVIAFWKNRVRPNHLRYVEPQKSLADIIIRG